MAIASEGSEPRFDAKLAIPDGVEGRHLGRLAAMAENFALVSFDTGEAADQSVAFVYARTPAGWIHEATLEPPTPQSFTFFSAIAASQERALLGSGSGRVWSYRRSPDGWEFDGELVRDQPVFESSFGETLDLAGDRAIVSTRQEFAPVETGAAYVFVRGEDGWRQEARLQPDVSPPASIFFGSVVAISNDHALVSHPGIFTPNVVYVFVRNGSTWAVETKLFGPQEHGVDQFGRSLSISGDWAVVGAHYDEDLHSQSGAVYVYARRPAGWVQEAKLLPKGSPNDFHFGETVRIHGDRIAVGTTSGATYVFARGPSGWYQEARLLAPDNIPPRQSWFGRALGISRDHAVIGDYLIADDLGAAYTYQLRPTEPSVGTELALHGGRFRVTASWQTAATAGTGTGVKLTEESGYFWFFNSSNVELTVKVLDACSTAFHNFWVFAAGQTNVGVELTIRDTRTGATRTYDNPLNVPFAPIQDTAAFTGCSP